MFIRVPFDVKVFWFVWPLFYSLHYFLCKQDSELLAERQSRESILAQVEAAAASAEAVTRLAAEETRRRTAEEKFVKMKDVYQKLRDEHINLIRSVSEHWLFNWNK